MALAPEVPVRFPLIALLLGALTARTAPPGIPGPGPRPGAAVVELFTSEGCSSCPPADRLLADLADEAARAGKPVFTLSFHVDYWNGLGWADPFSRPGFTARQQVYADALGGGLYTPEMVVNGTEAFVGSRGGEARRAIRAALARPAAAVGLRASADGRIVQVTYAVSGHAPGSVLQLALVEPERTVKVGRGENGGRILRHHDVVRAFATAPLPASGGGRAGVGVPGGLEPGSLRLIGFVQDPGTLAITGAAEAPIAAGDSLAAGG
jgi:hypothetical protein